MVNALVLNLFALLFLPTAILGDDRFATPEKTLNTYISALRRGDKAQAAACFYPESHHFYLPRPFAVEKIRIVKRIVHKRNERDFGYGSAPRRAGDVELHVEKVLDGHATIFFYVMRHVQGAWKIVSHAGDASR